MIYPKALSGIESTRAIGWESTVLAETSQDKKKLKKTLINKRENIRLAISSQTYTTQKGNEVVHGTALKPTLVKACSGQESRKHENMSLDTCS